MECPVCIEPFNKSTRTKITCVYCQYEACKQCVRQFLLQSPNTVCMSCKKTWNRGILNRELGASFVNQDYKKHQEGLLFEIEKSLIPESQSYVENAIRIEQLQEKNNGLHEKIRELQYEIGRIYHTIHDVNQNIRTLSWNRNRKITVVNQYQIPCVWDDCRGYINNQDGRCSVCARLTCRMCRQKRESDDHECNPDDVATVRMIHTECKNCPKCGVPVYKTEGCNQMWCTHCNTAFCWRTGELVSGPIHNPHYFEYMRNHQPTNREPVNDGCNQEMTWFRFQRRLVRYYRERTHPMVVRFEGLFRGVIHIREVDLNRYRVHRTDPLMDNMELRIQYIRGQIEENKYRSLIHQKHKKREKNREFYQILDMYVQTMNDIFTNIYDYPDKNLHDFVQQSCDDITTLREYVNRHLEDIGRIYKVSHPRLEDVS